MHIRLLYTLFQQTRKVSTDTRQITPGSVFFALKGPNFNANEFASEALARGAMIAVVDERRFAINDRYVLVDDVLKTLQELAVHHRNQLDIPVVALTGSNGKTTSKELVHAVLSKKFNVHATRGNLNNHIGVPLTILSIGTNAQIAVIEMGANHVGEIAALCRIANPTHGFVTNIGKAHIGTFGGFENIIRAKTELYDHLAGNNGTVFINSQNPLLVAMSSRFTKPVLYPGAGDYYQCSMTGSDPYLAIRAENGEEIRTQLTGAYNFENAAAALCIGKFFGVEPAAANDAVRSYVPSNMRSQVVVKGSNTIILDAYNANPSSMAAAIGNLASMKADRKVLILGDMFELEGEAEVEHRAIGKLIRENAFDDVFLCGDLFATARQELASAKYFPSREALEIHLRNHPISGSTILLKASRGMGLEKVLEFL
jgi:UDP-N-acetylmuramoyl-tripeptide--D-alanyl-D-alanine ligase